MKNGITIRKSSDPTRKTSYTLHFFNQNGKEKILLGHYVTANGSILDLGHIIHNWINHDSVPVDMVWSGLPETPVV